MRVARVFVEFSTIIPRLLTSWMGGVPRRRRLCYGIVLAGFRVDFMWWTNKSGGGLTATRFLVIKSDIHAVGKFRSTC